MSADNVLQPNYIKMCNFAVRLCPGARLESPGGVVLIVMSLAGHDG